MCIYSTRFVKCRCLCVHILFMSAFYVHVYLCEVVLFGVSLDLYRVCGMVVTHVIRLTTQL